jgi:crotonobetainyl-CoA:carnitine CoA-transferase CaiB-like acyl-CoA transferase
VANRDALTAAVEQTLGGEGVDGWLRRFDDAGVPAGRIAPLDAVYASPQVAHLGLVDEVDHPTLGTIRLPGSPVAYSRSRPGPSTAPPLLGAHDDGRWKPRER